ncbi:MAG: IS110 family transposase, partial [Cyclobacteriaceae bacterium]
MEKVSFAQVVKVGCGIDVHKEIIVATVRQNESEYETREFSSYTSSLTDLREWCKSKGVTH